MFDAFTNALEYDCPKCFSSTGVPGFGDAARKIFIIGFKSRWRDITFRGEKKDDGRDSLSRIDLELRDDSSISIYFEYYNKASR